MLSLLLRKLQITIDGHIIIKKCIMCDEKTQINTYTCIITNSKHGPHLQ